MLEWKLGEYWFEAKTSYGEYRVSDWGIGKWHVSFPGGSEIVEGDLDAAKAVAQKMHDERVVA